MSNLKDLSQLENLPMPSYLKAYLQDQLIKQAEVVTCCSQTVLKSKNYSSQRGQRNEGQFKIQQGVRKQSFWQKMYGLSGAYRALKYKAILLWLLLKNDGVPLFVKTSIITALGYLITPIDLIPDFLLGGLVDDGAVLAGVLKLANSYVTYGMEEEAERLCSQLFLYINQSYLCQLHLRFVQRSITLIAFQKDIASEQVLPQSVNIIKRVNP